jgi:hypothetical protein
MTLMTATLFLGACTTYTVHDAYYDYDAPVVRVAPPQPIYEHPGNPPVVGHVWIGGYWNWAGARYAWVPGRWEAPRHGHVWAPQRWERHEDHWRPHGGRWEPQGSRPHARPVQPQLERRHEPHPAARAPAELPQGPAAGRPDRDDRARRGDDGARRRHDRAVPGGADFHGALESVAR